MNKRKNFRFWFIIIPANGQKYLIKRTRGPISGRRTAINRPHRTDNVSIRPPISYPFIFRQIFIRASILIFGIFLWPGLAGPFPPVQGRRRKRFWPSVIRSVLSSGGPKRILFNKCLGLVHRHPSIGRGSQFRQNEMSLVSISIALWRFSRQEK